MITRVRTVKWGDIDNFFLFFAHILFNNINGGLQSCGFGRVRSTKDNSPAKIPDQKYLPPPERKKWPIKVSLQMG